MSYFPLSINLTGRKVFLVGHGPQIRQKEEKLEPFGAVLVRGDTFTEDDAQTAPALVIVGDTELSEAEKISQLCREYHIPVNVVDVPELCSFYFPALIARGDLTVSVSTGGKSPAAAAYLREQIEQMIPDNAEKILEWIFENREKLRKRCVSKTAIAAAFSRGRPLTEKEVEELPV